MMYRVLVVGWSQFRVGEPTPEYRAARDRLLEREIELRRAMEAVAAARRELPPGGRVTDYVFQGAGADGEQTDVPALGPV
jgi:predicted dithiol-disulfide oxidoreductase (DUF899 family)